MNAKAQMMKSNPSESVGLPITALQRVCSMGSAACGYQSVVRTGLPQLHRRREELISVLSQTGGHLGPNLGVVELTIALHRVQHADDRSVMDVSHQGYVHKMFTGRLDRFNTTPVRGSKRFLRPRANTIATVPVMRDGAVRRTRDGGWA
jgi:hypothetical protein